MQKLELNNWRNAAVPTKWSPIVKRQNKSGKADAGRRRAQISAANGFKSILVLFFLACQKGRF
jgi:hypothetical protein